MPGSKANFLEDELLDHVLSAATYTPPANVFLALFTVAPSDSGGGTEVTGGSYARKSVANNATNFPAASAGSKNLAVSQSFVTPTAPWGTVVAFGLFDALTVGNLLYWGWLGSDAGKIFTATVADVLTAPGHTLVNDDQVRVLTIPSATLPTGLSEGTTYFVVSVSGDTFSLSATQGGAAINITAAGAGLVAKIEAKPITTGDTVTFAGGALIITED
jgi:hypothetical protein